MKKLPDPGDAQTEPNGIIRREVITAADTIHDAQLQLDASDDAKTKAMYAEIIESARSKGDLVTDSAALKLNPFNTLDASITHSNQGATSEINTHDGLERITAYNSHCLELVSYNKSDPIEIDSPEVVRAMNETVDAVFKGKLTPEEALALSKASEKMHYCAKDGVFDPAETLEIQNLLSIARKEGERGV